MPPQTIPFGTSQPTQAATSLPFGGKTAAPITPTQPVSSGSIWSQLASGVVKTGQNYGSNITGAIDHVRQLGKNAYDAGVGGNPIDEAKAIGALGIGAPAAAVQAIFAPIAAPIQTLLNHVASVNEAHKSAGIPTMTDSFLVSPQAQEARKQITDWAQQHPVLSQVLGDAFTVGTAGLGSGALNTTVSDAASSVKNGVLSKITSAKNAVFGTPEQQAAQQSANQLADQAALKAKTETAVNSVANDWQKPTTINKPAFNKARAVVENSPQTPQFLAKQGLSPATHIEDGKYATADSADALRSTAGKMSSETLRPSLQVADYSTPKTPVSDITDATIKDIQASKDITAGDRETQITKAQSEGEALAKKYPDGMSLENMHDEKITYASNGRYSPVGDTTVNNTANVNRSFGRALASQVEAKAPAGVPVKDFNAYLAQYYKAADYLDSLNGKTAPVTKGQQIARGVARFGGAAIGGHFGGGVVSEFAGYQIGKALEHAAENLTNPMRATFLDNLEKTNPQAFTKVQDYMRSASQGNTGTLRLPAAGPDSPIPLGPDTTTPKPSVAPYAVKGEPVQDPKTGRITSVFTSEPKGNSVFHGTSDGKLSLDENGNVNFGTKGEDVAQFTGQNGKIIKVPLNGLNVKDFSTKSAMFEAASNGKAANLKNGIDVLRSGNHAIGINPEKIAKLFGLATKDNILSKLISDLMDSTPK